MTFLPRKVNKYVNQSLLITFWKDEVISPDSVKSFLKILYKGNLSTNEELSSKKSRLIDFSAADAVFCCFAGKLILGKQLSLGLALKAITRSKKVLTLMNEYGHCSETVRRVDMSLESTLNNSEYFIPDGIKTKPNLSTRTVWDNFNINLETPSGANTSHHIYGVCYQTIRETDETETDISKIHLNLNQPAIIISKQLINYNTNQQL